MRLSHRPIRCRIRSAKQSTGHCSGFDGPRGLAITYFGVPKALGVTALAGQGTPDQRVLLGQTSCGGPAQASTLTTHKCLAL